jgi:hypothetical protein
MKNIKKFNEYNTPTDIYEDIAKDIYPEIEELTKNGDFTFEDFEKFMKDRDAKIHTIDGVATYLVNMGINFA